MVSSPSSKVSLSVSFFIISLGISPSRPSSSFGSNCLLSRFFSFHFFLGGVISADLSWWRRVRTSFISPSLGLCLWTRIIVSPPPLRPRLPRLMSSAPRSTTPACKVVGWVPVLDRKHGFLLFLFFFFFKFVFFLPKTNCVRCLCCRLVTPRTRSNSWPRGPLRRFWAGEFDHGLGRPSIEKDLVILQIRL